MKWAIIERLHRHCFDNIYVQNRKDNYWDKIVLWVYDKLVTENPNWRYELHQHGKTFVRYSDFDRIGFINT